MPLQFENAILTHFWMFIISSKDLSNHKSIKLLLYSLTMTFSILFLTFPIATNFSHIIADMSTVCSAASMGYVCEPSLNL